MSKETKKSNVKELPGLNGNAYSASRYLYTNIKKRPLVVESKKEKSLKEKITYEFDDNGGIIVLSTDVNAQQLSQNKLMNWIKKKVATLKNRVSADKNIKNAVLNNVPETGWTVGKYLRGRYHAADGSDFDENSLSVELLGLPTDVLVSIAEDLCNEFKQESVIVKDYNKNKVYIVNGEKEVKEESMNEDYWQNTSHSARVREYEDGTKQLFSYGTLIATIKPDGDVELTRYWNYSRTTGQHLRDFLRKYGVGNYGASKDIYNDLIRKRKVKTDNIELRKASALDNAIECIRFGDCDKDECDWCGLSEKDFDEIWKQAKKEVRELNKKNKNNINKKEDKEMKEAKYTQRPEKMVVKAKKSIKESYNNSMDDAINYWFNEVMFQIENLDNTYFDELGLNKLSDAELEGIGEDIARDIMDDDYMWGEINDRIVEKVEEYCNYCNEEDEEDFDESCKSHKSKKVIKESRLPKSVKTTTKEIGIADDYNADDEEEEEAIGDWLSDKYGFCHYGFNFEIKDGNINITNIEWDTSESLKKSLKESNESVKYVVHSDIDENSVYAEFDNEDEAIDYAEECNAECWVDECYLDEDGEVIDYETIWTYLDESCKPKKLTKKVVRESKANKNDKK